MKLLIIKTNIENRSKVRTVGSLLAFTPQVYDWSIDMEDTDKVLRVEAEDQLEEKDLIELLNDYGLHCEALPD